MNRIARDRPSLHPIDRRQEGATLRAAGFDHFGPGVVGDQGDANLTAQGLDPGMNQATRLVEA